MAARETEARLRLTATDMTGQAFREAARNMQNFAHEADKLTERSKRHEEALRERVLGGLSGLKTRLGEAAGAWLVGKEMRESITEFAAMERRMNRMGVQTQQSTARLAETREQLQRIARDTATPMDDVVTAMDKLVQLRGNLEQAEQLMGPVARANQAFGGNIVNTAEAANSMVQNFHIAEKDVPRMFDEMATAAHRGQMQTNDLARGMNDLGERAEDIGWKGPEGARKLVTALEAVRRGTGSSETALIGLGNVMDELRNKRLQKSFENVGANLGGRLDKAVREGRDQLDTFVDTVDERLRLLAKNPSRGMSEDQRFSLIGKLIPEREMARAVIALIKFRDYQNDLNRTMRERPDTIENDRKRFEDTQAAVDRLAIAYKELKESVGQAAVTAGALELMKEFETTLKTTAEEIDRIAHGLKTIFSMSPGQWLPDLGKRAEATSKLRQAERGGLGFSDAFRGLFGMSRGPGKLDTKAAEIAEHQRAMQNFEERVQRGYKGGTGPLSIDNQRARQQERLKQLNDEMAAMARELIQARKEVEALKEEHGGGHGEETKSHSAPGSATEETNREHLKEQQGQHQEQRETNEHLKTLIQKQSYGPGGQAPSIFGGPGAQGSEAPGRAMGGGMETGSHGGGGRFNVGAGRGRGAGGGRAGGGGEAPAPEAPADTPDARIERVIGKLPEAQRDRARQMLGALSPEDKKAVTSGEISVREMLKRKMGPLAGMGESQISGAYPGGIDQLQKDITTAPPRAARAERAADDGAPIAGATNPRLAGSRKPYFDELDRDPQLRRDVIKTASLENRGSPQKLQAVIESMVNRSRMNRYSSLRQAIHSGFYGPVNRGGLRGQLSDKDRRDGEAALKAVREGSNMIGYRTDQGMLTDPGARKYMREPDHSGHRVVAGENFFYMGQKGRRWAKEQEAADQTFASKNGGAETKVSQRGGQDDVGDRQGFDLSGAHDDLQSLRDSASKPISLRFEGQSNLSQLRERSARAAQREMDRDMRRVRHHSLTDVGVW